MMKKNQKSPENVVPIKQQAITETHLEARQEAIRRARIEAAMQPPESAAIAGICISMKPDGTVRAVANCIEPDQVDAFLRSMDDLRKKLEAHRDDVRLRATVSSLAKRCMSIAITATATAFLCMADASLWPAVAGWQEFRPNH